MRPRVFWVRAVVGQRWCEAFEIVREREHVPNPVSEDSEPLECEQICNAFFGANLPQESEELHEPSVTSGRW